MKRTVLLLVLIAVSVGFAAQAALAGGTAEQPGTAGGPPAPQAGKAPAATEKKSDQLAKRIDPALIDANTRFAFAVVRELALEEGGKNLFISPLSILMALAMTYNGAVGDTAAAMAETLQFSGSSAQQLNQGFGDLMSSVTDADETVDISIANSIWYERGYSVQEQFIATNRSFYSAEIQQLVFADPAAKDAINGWIAEATRGKINEMFDKPLPKGVVMYLINAIYFKGDWTCQFSESATREEDFRLQAGGLKKVPMMHLKEQLRHARGDSFGLLRLPYGREKLAMYVLLPDEGENLDTILAEMDDQLWNELKSELRPAEVDLAMPRYKVEYGRSLREVLAAMGMGIAFGPGADFTGIDPENPELHISDVIHKAVVDVNEQGSEAAAVTAVATEKSLPPPPIRFIVDRPFFFAIADDRTGSILFMGKVADP